MKKLLIPLVAALSINTAHSMQLSCTVAPDQQELELKLAKLLVRTFATDKAMNSGVSLDFIRFYDRKAKKLYQMGDDPVLVRVVAMKLDKDVTDKSKQYMHIQVPSHGLLMFPKKIRFNIDKESALELKVILDDETQQTFVSIPMNEAKRFIQAKQVGFEVQYSNDKDSTEKGSMNANELGALQSLLTTIAVGPQLYNKMCDKPVKS